MFSLVQVLREVVASKYFENMELQKLSQLADRQLQKTHEMAELTKTASRITVKLIQSKFMKYFLQNISTADSYTAEHSINTCFFSIVIGKLLGYREKDLHTIGMGALLHDIGKIRIPKEILNKKGRLSDDEMTVVKKHPILGYDIVRRKIFQNAKPEVLTIILQHHERCDGSGYPNGLTRQDIHPFSLIVATADVFDAVTTNRVYQKARSIPEGAKLILQLGEKGELAKETTVPFITKYVGGFMEQK